MLREILNKFLHKNESTTLASIHDFVYIPKREELSLEKQQKLDEYKNRYLEILKTKRTITSIDLNISALRDNLEMYMSFLLSMLEQEEDKLVSFEKINKEQEEPKELENQIKMGKLKLYFYRIVSIEGETTLRAAALLEILNEKFILSPNKKRSITEEINNLASNLLSFKNQRVAINHEIERYLIESGFIEEERSPENAIEEKYKELCKIFEVLGLDSSSYKDLSATNIIFMEEEIEQYIYHHPEIEYLRDKVHFLSVEYYNKLVIRDYLEEIEEIEFKYKIYNDYGRKLVSYEEIEKLYRFKFDILTSGIGTNVDINITENVTYTELEIYMKIIEEKIEALVMGTNSNIKNTGIPVQELLSLIIEILKNGEREFSVWDILNDRKKLCLLLSFDKDISLEWFFHILDDRRREIYDMVDFYDLHMKWSELLPLSSIYQMMGYNIKCDDLWEQYNSRIEGLYFKLYQMCQDQYIKVHPEKERIFRFPEGITEIDFRYSDTIIDLLNKEMEGKDIYTPSTLKILGKLPLQTIIKAFYLNEGLEKIKCSNSFQNMEARTLYLPSSLNDVDNLNDVLELCESVYLYEHQLSCEWLEKANSPFKIVIQDTGSSGMYISKIAFNDEEFNDDIEDMYIHPIKDFEKELFPFIFNYFNIRGKFFSSSRYLAPKFERLVIIPENPNDEKVILDQSQLVEYLSIFKGYIYAYLEKSVKENIKENLELKDDIIRYYFEKLFPLFSRCYKDVHIDYHENGEIMKKRIYEVFDYYLRYIILAHNINLDGPSYPLDMYLTFRNLVVHMPGNEIVTVDVSECIFSSCLYDEKEAETFKKDAAFQHIYHYGVEGDFEQFIKTNFKQWEEKMLAYEKEAAKDFFYQKLQEKGLARVLKKL